jgi:hypothetical protein
MINLRNLVMLAVIGLFGCALSPSGSKNELIEPFDLICLPAKPETGKLVFHFLPSDENGVIARRMNETELVDFETHTYENALLWKNGLESFAVNRFNGELIRKPSGEKYYCAKLGRRVF